MNQKERRRALLVGIAESRGDIHMAADPGAALELARLPVEGGGEPDLVEHLGTQARGDAAHGIDDAVDRVAQRLLFLGARRRRIDLEALRERVEVELKGFNDRALNRDLETLCAKVAQEQPRLPDGRRLLFRMQGAGILHLDAQEQAVL